MYKISIWHFIYTEAEMEKLNYMRQSFDVLL